MVWSAAHPATGRRQDLLQTIIIFALILTCSTLTYSFVQLCSVSRLKMDEDTLMLNPATFLLFICMHAGGGGQYSSLWSQLDPAPPEATGNPPGSDGAAKEATLSWRFMTRWESGWLLRETLTVCTLVCFQRLWANLLVWAGRDTHTHTQKVLLLTDVAHLCIGYNQPTCCCETGG